MSLKKFESVGKRQEEKIARKIVTFFLPQNLHLF